MLINKDRQSSSPGTVRSLGVEKFPIEPYLSKAFYEGEKRAVWPKAWLLAGRASDVAHPGDFFQFAAPVVDASVLVVRGKDGNIRAFHNACRHRGARVKFPHECSGSTKAFTCRYHGWVYGLDGELLHIPEEGQFGKLPERSSLGLKPVAVDVWGGMIFVNLSPEPGRTLREYLGPLSDALGDYLEQEDWRWGTGWKGVFASNWKHLIDVQIEGYHATPMHRQTLGRLFTPEDIQSELYPDAVGVAAKLTVLRPTQGTDLTAVGKLAMRYGQAAIWTDQDASQAGEKYPGAINTQGHARWVFDIYTILPNLVLQVSHEHFAIQLVWPLGPHRTLWSWDYYYRNKPQTFGQQFAREFNRIVTFNALSEDIPPTEGVDANVRAGVVDGMYLCDLEGCVRSYLNKLVAAVNAVEATPARTGTVRGRRR
jgi:phenylpropionate dioxygenase-like ring-hydroxylating dioxygenase large terminal subunit